MGLTQPIRNLNEVCKIAEYYEKLGQHRNQLLMVFQLLAALRISDVLNIKCEQVYNFKTGQPLKIISIKEKKTGKTRTIELNQQIIDALIMYYPQARKGQSLILNKKTGKPISRSHATRLVAKAGEAVGINQKVSCHSLRKTFGYQAWKMGTSPVILMEIYGHSSYKITRRYLGITQDELNIVYTGLNFKLTT